MFRKEAQKSYSSGYLCVKSTNNQPGLLHNITMKQHSTPNRSLLKCQFQKDSETILLSDLKKNLLKFNLSNLHYTPILAQKVSYFEFYSYDKDRIYVVSSENQSKLYLVNTINKKWQRWNLNINKIVAFEINLQRNLILVADPVIMNIFDERTKIETLTYRPPKQQRILKALFTADNKSVLVLTSNMNIKQLSLHDLEEEFSAFLPVGIQDPQVSLSGNNKYLVVTGSSHQLTLMTDFADKSPKFTVLGFPFKIKSTKFDVHNNLVILGRDQIIYYYIIEENRLVRLFNYMNQDVIHNFDISLDNKYLCGVSNFGTIFIFTLRDTLDLWRQKKQSFEQKKVITITQYIPVKEQVDGQQLNDRQNPLKQQIKDIPNQSFYVGSSFSQDFPPEALKNPELGQHFAALKHKFSQDTFFKQNGVEIVQLIYAFHKLIPRNNFSVSHYFLKWIIQSQCIVDQLGLVLCPSLIPIIEKRFNLNFKDFIMKSLTGLFINYFNKSNWTFIIKSLLINKSDPQILLAFFFTYLNSILSSIKECKNVNELQNILRFTGSQEGLGKVIEKAVSIARNEKYDIIFSKLIQMRFREEGEEKKSQRVSGGEGSKSRLRELLEKREDIEENIGNIEAKKGKIKLN